MVNGFDGSWLKLNKVKVKYELCWRHCKLHVYIISYLISTSVWFDLTNSAIKSKIHLGMDLVLKCQHCHFLWWIIELSSVWNMNFVEDISNYISVVIPLVSNVGSVSFGWFRISQVQFEFCATNCNVPKNPKESWNLTSWSARNWVEWISFRLESAEFRHNCKRRHPMQQIWCNAIKLNSIELNSEPPSPTLATEPNSNLLNCLFPYQSRENEKEREREREREKGSERERIEDIFFWHQA